MARRFHRILVAASIFIAGVRVVRDIVSFVSDAIGWLLDTNRDLAIGFCLGLITLCAAGLAFIIVLRWCMTIKKRDTRKRRRLRRGKSLQLLDGQ